MACTAHSNTTTCGGHSNLSSCSGHAATISCTAHSVTTACPAHVGGTGVCPTHTGRINPVTRTVWSESAITNVTVKATHINELRNALSAEATRRDLPGVVGDLLAAVPSVSAGGGIDNVHIIGLRNAINSMAPFVFPGSLTDGSLEDGDIIQDDSVVALRSKTWALQDECVCNCNYGCSCQCDYTCTCKCNYACTCQCNYGCTCQCNYVCTCNCNYPCTCDCNYCTCDCNYCTCDCDYNCTCDCNYSDENLKLEIEYL